MATEPNWTWGKDSPHYKKMRDSEAVTAERAASKGKKFAGSLVSKKGIKKGVEKAVEKGGWAAAKGLAGRAMGALSGIGGAAFGVMSVMDLISMLSNSGGDRRADDMAAAGFLNDPMIGEELSQLAMKQSLNGRVGVTGQPISTTDDMFLQDVMERHGQRMRSQMRRTPPTTAELAAAAGLL